MKSVLIHKLFLLVFVLSFVTFTAHTLVTKNAVFGDSRFYYAITRSIIKDQDINFTNEYEYFGIKMATNIAGMPINFYPPGLSFFWLPGFWSSETLAVLIPELGLKDGFGLPYQFGIAAVSIFLGVLGLYFNYLSLRKFFSDPIALTTCMALFLTTNLFFYIAVEPTTPHSASFFLSSLFTFIFLNVKVNPKNSLMLGFIAGTAGIVRTQDVGLLFLPVIKFISNRKVKILPMLLVGFLLGFLPQIIFWKIFYETFFRSPYMNYGFSFSIPQLFYVLFNTKNGLFIITPVILPAFLGLFIFLKKNLSAALYALFYFILQLLIISFWRDYNQGGSYGIRMMITAYPLLSLGLAAVIEKITSRVGYKFTRAVISVLALINFLLIIRYLLMY